jgi:hypothetical protein
VQDVSQLMLSKAVEPEPASPAATATARAAPSRLPSIRHSSHLRTFAAALLLTLAFALLVSFIPLQIAVRIGPDEGLELSKVTLVQKGYKLYTEVWNDQPPLYTSLLRHVTNLGPSRIFGPRFLTVCFSLLLIIQFSALRSARVDRRTHASVNSHY